MAGLAQLTHDSLINLLTSCSRVVITANYFPLNFFFFFFEIHE